MTKQWKLIAVLVVAVAALPIGAETIDALREQVRQTEIAFAKTMADRDHEAFASFIASDAVFLSGSTALRGRDAIASAWQRVYESPEAPGGDVQLDLEPGSGRVLEDRLRQRVSAV